MDKLLLLTKMSHVRQAVVRPIWRVKSKTRI